jgi:hypothetical protein
MHKEMIMIEKVSPFELNSPLLAGRRHPSSGAASSSPFYQILGDELSGPSLLEKTILEFLIKTMESIMSLERQKDPSAFSLGWPISGPIGFEGKYFTEKAAPESNQEIAQDQPKGQEIDGIIQEASERFGVDPSLIRAVISVESNGNPRAVSPAGAQGLMQLMPATAAELGVTDPFNPRQNILAGTRYLSRLLDRYQGNRSLALAAYNWGMGNLEKNPKGLPQETRNYLVRVEKKFQTYQKNTFPA